LHASLHRVPGRPVGDAALLGEALETIL
jgi:hypothetical protein